MLIISLWYNSLKRQALATCKYFQIQMYSTYEAHTLNHHGIPDSWTFLKLLTYAYPLSEFSFPISRNYLSCWVISLDVHLKFTLTILYTCKRTKQMGFLKF